MSFLTPHLSNLNIRKIKIKKSGKATYQEAPKPTLTDIKHRKEWCDRQMILLKFNPSNAVLK